MKQTINQKPITESANNQKLFRLLLGVLLATLAIGLGYAVLSLPMQAPGLSELVAENLENSGVKNPVTAVLLNFRGYDTLLEMGVLLLALIAVWSIGTAPQQCQTEPSAVLDILSRLLVPLLIMVSGYLLWVGAHAPGGAFQAGAVLAAAGVLLLLSGWQLSAKLAGLLLRLMITAGLLVFLVIAVVLIVLGGELLEYPSVLAGELIFLIEAVATLSIGITLAAIFFGSRPQTEHQK